MGNGMKTELAASVDWNEFNKELTSVVNGDNYCSRRQAMTRAAAVAAGVALTTVSSPAFAAETKVVLELIVEGSSLFQKRLPSARATPSSGSTTRVDLTMSSLTKIPSQQAYRKKKSLWMNNLERREIPSP